MLGLAVSMGLLASVLYWFFTQNSGHGPLPMPGVGPHVWFPCSELRIWRNYGEWRYTRNWWCKNRPRCFIHPTTLTRRAAACFNSWQRLLSRSRSESPNGHGHCHNHRKLFVLATVIQWIWVLNLNSHAANSAMKFVYWQWRWIRFRAKTHFYIMLQELQKLVHGIVCFPGGRANQHLRASIWHHESRKYCNLQKESGPRLYFIIFRVIMFVDKMAVNHAASASWVSFSPLIVVTEPVSRSSTVISASHHAYTAVVESGSGFVVVEIKLAWT